ncbi:unnamed protein product [Arctogadus glacialis]
MIAFSQHNSIMDLVQFFVTFFSSMHPEEDCPGPQMSWVQPPEYGMEYNLHKTWLHLKELLLDWVVL